MANKARTIWERNNGKIPKGMTVDHINGDSGDNRLSNLRLATTTQQNQNRGHFRNNTSGYKGVRQSGVKFTAVVTANKVRHYLGTFDTAEEASAAYQEAAEKLHGEFYRG